MTADKQGHCRPLELIGTQNVAYTYNMDAAMFICLSLVLVYSCIKDTCTDTYTSSILL